MEQFSYSFAASMIHSLWQSAILLGLYYVVTVTVRNIHPLSRRDLLYSLIGAQLVISAAIFFLYYTGSFNSMQNAALALVSRVIPRQELLQQYAPWLFYIWLLTVVYKTIGNAHHWLKFKKDYRTALVKPPVDIKVFTGQKALHFGINKKVAIWYSRHIQSPVVFGFLKPIILLPVALVNQLSIAETEALIIHELTHIRYNDYILNWLLLAAETVWFFNPFIRIMAAAIKLEREKNCDIQVLQFNYCNISYADALLKTAKLRYRLHSFQLAAVFNKSQLLTRIRFFSTEKNLEVSRRNSLPFSIAGLLLVIVITVSLLSNKQNLTKEINNVTNVNIVPAKVAPSQTTPASVENAVVLTENIERAEASTASGNKMKMPGEKIVIADHENDPYTYKEQTTDVPEITIMPVSFKATTTATIQAEEVKEVIINEESSTGKTITKAYRVKLQNGKWISEPLWVIAEVKSTDSLSRKNPSDTIWEISPATVAQ